MSSNLSVVNFAVGGGLTVSGKTTLAETILSSSTASFQGVSTTSLNVTGTSTFNNSLPTSTQTPLLDAQLTTKFYVDTADSIQKTYIDDADLSLNTRITSVDSSRKTYIDEADLSLNTRITSVDSLRKTYIDEQDTILNTRITNTDAAQKIYIDSYYKPNDVIQMKVYNKGDLTSTYAQGTTYTSLFTEIFSSKSNDSTIQVIFDCQWGISGLGNTDDSWKSSIFINNVIVATKNIVFNNDNRHSCIALFPISGAIKNYQKGNIFISIKAAAIQSVQDQTLTLNSYNVTFVEIQN